MYSERTALLRCDNLTKRFGGLTAVKDVSFEVQEGEIFAIVGPNGAGKTTLFEVIAGFTSPTSGDIYFGGAKVTNASPDRMWRRGVARTFQTTTAFHDLTVLDNVLVGASHGVRDSIFSRLHFSDDSLRSALRAIQFCDLLPHCNRRAGDLSSYQRKRLMIATALAASPRLLLLDEPVAGLNRQEREETQGLIRRLNEGGITVLMIEHLMKAVQALASRMLVLHYGEKIAEGSPERVLHDERVIEIYLGQEAKRFAQAAVANETK